MNISGKKKTVNTNLRVQGRIQKRIVYTGRLSGAGDRDGVRTQSVHVCSLAYFNKPSF